MPSEEWDFKIMRLVVFATMLLSVSGCGRAQPTMAARKWAEALHHANSKERKKAAFTLGNIGPSDPAVVPALMAALKDADAGVRCEAIFALVKCGPAAQEAIPDLTDTQNKDHDPKVRAYAAKALEKLKEDR